MSDPRAALLVFVLLTGGTAACGGETEAKRCETADDCSAPFLCCTAGVILEAEGGGGPRCVIPDPSLAFCDVYLPHLIEGNPCLRIPAEEAPVDPVTAGYDPPPPAADLCREGLTCCPGSLTCEKPDACEAPADVPDGKSGSGKACHADEDCRASEVCCGISYYDREGRCTFVRDCVGVPPGSTAASSVGSTGSG